MMRVPLVVPAPLASRHRPDAALVTVPFELNVHCCAVVVVQSLIWAALPWEVPASCRHLVPNRVSWLLLFSVQVWLPPPLQSYSVCWVPLAWFQAGSSRQRPEAVPTRAKVLDACPVVMARLSNWAVSPWLVPNPICPVVQVESVTEPTVAPSMTA